MTSSRNSYAHSWDPPPNQWTPTLRLLPSPPIKDGSFTPKWVLGVGDMLPLGGWGVLGWGGLVLEGVPVYGRGTAACEGTTWRRVGTAGGEGAVANLHIHELVSQGLVGPRCSRSSDGGGVVVYCLICIFMKRAGRD